MVVFGNSAPLPGQDVLEKAIEETLRREPHRSSLAAATVSITEGDEAAVVVEDALGTEGGAINVSGEVLEGGLAPADRAHILAPIAELGALAASHACPRRPSLGLGSRWRELRSSRRAFDGSPVRSPKEGKFPG